MKYFFLPALIIITTLGSVTPYAQTRSRAPTGAVVLVNTECTIRGARIGIRGWSVSTATNSRRQTTEFSRAGIVVARSVVDIAGTTPVGMFTEVMVGGAFKTFPKEQPVEAKKATLEALGVTARELGTCVAPHVPQPGERGTIQT